MREGAAVPVVPAGKSDRGPCVEVEHSDEFAVCNKWESRAGDQTDSAGRGSKPRPSLVGCDGLEVMALAVAQALDAGAVIELVLEGVEIEAAGVRRRTSANTVNREHLDADPVALTQRVASKIDDVLGGAGEGFFVDEGLGERGEALRALGHLRRRGSRRGIPPRPWRDRAA